MEKNEAGSRTGLVSSERYGEGSGEGEEGEGEWKGEWKREGVRLSR